MSREVHVRFWESPGAKFPRATRPPLYRQCGIFARLGIDIPRSTLIGWTGSAIAELHPIAGLIDRSTLTATQLHCDDTIIPVLASKTGQTKKGRMWVVVQDGRPIRDPIRRR